MKSLVRILVLFTCFAADIQVKAANHVIRASVKRTFADGEFRLHMDTGSLMEQRDDKNYQLVEGRFLAELNEGVRLTTPFATMSCLSSRCEALISREKNKVEVSSLRGGLVIRRVGEKKDYVLPPATRVIVMPVTGDGAAEMEFPQSLPWDSTVKDWARLFPGTAAEFKETLIQFREDWRNAVDQISRIHVEYAQREIASHEKILAEQQARRAVQEREDGEMRKLFRLKNFIDP